MSGNKTRLLSARQTAERLGVAHVTIKKWCRSGRFPGAHKVGREWLIPEEDLQYGVKRTPGRPPNPIRDLARKAK